MKATALGACLLCLLAPSAMAQQSETIGHVRQMTGTAKIFRGADPLLAAVGAPLHRGDLIRTDKPGAMGIVLLDDTTVSLGSNSELALNGFDFIPREGKFSVIMRMVKGTFVYVSGQISKFAPETIQLSVPDATIAIRGTKLLVEIQD